MFDRQGEIVSDLVFTGSHTVMHLSTERPPADAECAGLIDKSGRSQSVGSPLGLDRDIQGGDRTGGEPKESGFHSTTPLLDAGRVLDAG